MTPRLRHLARLFLLTSGGVASFSATLTGRIYTDQGPPVGGIAVIVQPIVAAPTGLVTYPALTDAQGKFVVTVPAGASYSVCAGSPNQGLLNSCEWSAQQSVVQVAASATAAQIVLTLATGTVMHLRVADSAGLLARPGVAATASGKATAPAADPPAVQFGLWDATGHYHLVPLTSGDDKGVNFEILVPLNADFKLTTQGTSIQVADQAGASALGTPKSVSSRPNGNAAQTLVFQSSPATVLSVSPSSTVGVVP